MRRGLARLLNREASRAFVGWVEWAKQVAASLGLMHRAALFMSDGKLAVGLSTWRYALQNGFLRASPMDKAVGYFVNRNLTAAWKSWVSEHAEHVLQKLKSRRAIGRIINQQLARAWESWQGMLIQMAPLRRGASYFVNSNLSRAWISWMAQASERSRLQSTISESLIRLRSQELFKAWDEWATFAWEERTIAFSKAVLTRSYMLVGLFGWWKGLRARVRPDCEPRRPAAKPLILNPEPLPALRSPPPIKAREPERLPRKPGQSPIKTFKGGPTPPQAKPLTPNRGSVPRPQGRPLGSTNSPRTPYTPRTPEKWDYYL